MDSTYFLLSSINREGTSHILLHKLACPSVNAEVFVLVDNFEKLKNLRIEFPTVNFILLDPTKNSELTTGHLRILPGIDCYINFDGELFNRELSRVSEIPITQEEDLRTDNITLGDISRVLYRNNDQGASVINIYTEGTIGSAFKEILARFKADPTEGSSFSRFRTSGKFRPNPNSSTTTPYTSPVRGKSSENEPLIPKRPRLPQEQPPPTSGFLACLFCFCYAYCCPSQNDPSETFEFDTKEEVRCYVRMEHSREIKRNMDRLYDQSIVEWERALRRLEAKESSKLEELASKVQEKKDYEEMELQKRKDSDNAATEGRLLPEDMKAKIKATREKQLKNKLRYDTEQSFREGSHLIRQAAEIEKEILTANHYSTVLASQFEILTNTNYKYKSKLDRLLLKYFQRAARNV